MYLILIQQISVIFKVTYFYIGTELLAFWVFAEQQHSGVSQVSNICKMELFHKGVFRLIKYAVIYTPLLRRPLLEMLDDIVINIIK